MIILLREMFVIFGEKLELYVTRFLGAELERNKVTYADIY